jgi:hypothetical protein
LTAGAVGLGLGIVAGMAWSALTWRRPWPAQPRPLVYAAALALSIAATRADASGRERLARGAAMAALALLVLAAIGLGWLAGQVGATAAYW